MNTVQIFKCEPLLYCNNKFIITLIYLFTMMFTFNVKTCTGFVHVKNPINQLMSFIQGSYISPLKNHTVQFQQIIMRVTVLSGSL
jgi:hypothetical protein